MYPYRHGSIIKYKSSILSLLIRQSLPVIFAIFVSLLIFSQNILKYSLLFDLSTANNIIKERRARLMFIHLGNITIHKNNMYSS